MPPLSGGAASIAKAPRQNNDELFSEFGTKMYRSWNGRSTIVERTVVKILAENVGRFREYYKIRGSPLGTIHGLAKAANCGPASVQRALAGDGSTTAAIVDRIARAFGLQPYQLLIPDLDPAAPQASPHVDDVAVAINATSGSSSESQIADVLSRNLSALMKAQGLSQNELARRAGMPQTTVGHVINSLGTGQVSRLDTLVKLARGLGVSVSELLSTAAERAVPAQVQEPPYSVARDASRLLEDFLLADAKRRKAILSFAESQARDNEARTGKRR